MNEELSANRTSGLVRSRDGAEGPGEGGDGAAAAVTPRFSLSEHSTWWAAGALLASVILATVLVWASGASLQNFAMKLGYLIAFMPLFYAACAVIQLTIARPKTRYVIIGSFATFAFLIGLTGLLFFAVPNAATNPENQRQSAYLLLVMAGVTFIPMFKRVRLFLGRVTPLDPNSTVDISGVIVALWYIVVSGTSLLFVDLEAIASQIDINVSDSLLYAIAEPLVALSLVGIWITRTPREAVKRLGLERPTLRQVIISLGIVVPFVMLGIGLDAIGRQLQPDLYAQLARILAAMSGNVTNPFIALILGFSAGIGEEILYRGAIQPRLGIVLTTIVFAISHTQYGISYGTIAVIIMGFTLGYQRKYMNTTSSIITHGAYNTVAFLISYFAQNGS